MKGPCEDRLPRAARTEMLPGCRQQGKEEGPSCGQ